MMLLPLSLRLKWFRLKSRLRRRTVIPPDLLAIEIDPDRKTLLLIERPLTEDQRRIITQQLKRWLESDKPIAILDGVGAVTKVTREQH